MEREGGCIGSRKEEVRAGDKTSDELRVVEKEDMLLIIKDDFTGEAADAYKNLVLELGTFSWVELLEESHGSGEIGNALGVAYEIIAYI